MERLNRQNISIVFFVVLFLFLLYQAGQMLAPFFGPILAALTASIVCYPLHRRLGRALKNRRPTLQALLSIFFIFLFVVGPLTVIVSSTVNEARMILPEVKPTVQSATQRTRVWVEAHQHWKERVPPRLVALVESNTVDLEDRLQSVAETFAQWVAASATGLAKDILNFIVNLVFFLFLLFFLFRDGEAMVDSIAEHLPLSVRVRELVFTKIQEITIGVVRGSIIVGLLQGTFAMIGYLIVGARASVLLGCMTAVASFIPAVGTGIIWAPVCLFYFLSGSFGAGLFLLIWGIIMGTLDNVVRPLVVGSKGKMPFLWLSLALVGGLSLFGFKGLLLGPLVFALLPIFLELFRVQLTEVKN